MTKKENEYLDRLRARCRMLEARLSQTPEAATFRVEIQKELNAIKWAVAKLEATVRI